VRVNVLDSHDQQTETREGEEKSYNAKTGCKTAGIKRLLTPLPWRGTSCQLVANERHNNTNQTTVFIICSRRYTKACRFCTTKRIISATFTTMWQAQIMVRMTEPLKE